MICSKCGTNVPDDSKFCVRCGNKIEKPVNPVGVKVCPGCGTELKPGAKFCTKCGMKQEGQPAPQPVPQPTPQPVPQPAPQPTPQPVPQPTPQPDPKKKKGGSGKKVAIVFVVIFLVVGLIAGTCYALSSVFDINPIEAIAGLFGGDSEDIDDEKDDSEEENKDGDKKGIDEKDTDGKDSTSEESDSKNESETTKGDVTLLEPANELAEQAKAEHEAGNYLDGAIPHGKEAIVQYITVAEENNLKEEAQEGIDNVFWRYADSVIRYCDGLKAQGANAGLFEQISLTLSDATDLVATLTEKGYTVDSEELYAYKSEAIQVFRDNFIESINNITKYENWSRDEAWSYADQAYSVKENGKPLLFDDEDLDDPLRMRYVYCLAWKTRKVCENGIADGSMTNESAAQSMIAILKETDYNLLLIQDIITYGSAAGMDVEKYRNAYNAIVDEVKSEQNLTIRNNAGVNSTSSVDLQHFWYFNDLDGEDKYKVDTHNGTKASTREWIRSNIPGLLDE